MNARLAVAFLSLVASTGCIIVPGGGGSGGGSGGGAGGGGGGGKSGNVVFSWTFGGKTCGQSSSVNSVVIDIPGETLNMNGVYPCLDNTSYPGVTLKNFLPGSYNYSIKAIDSSSTTLFTGSGTFKINGDTRVDIDLTPAGGPNSFAYLGWTFPPLAGAANPTCTQAGITSVKVSIDGAADKTYACSEGVGTTPTAQTPYLASGSHSIRLSAVDSVGYEYFRFTGTLTTFAGNPVDAAYQLPWSVGGVAVKWSISDSLGAISCAMAGITDMYINFEDLQAHLVYPSTTSSPGDKKPCNSSGVEYPYLKPGIYKVRLTAFGSGTSVYQEAIPAVTVTVVAGQFVTVGSATNIPMVRTQ